MHIIVHNELGVDSDVAFKKVLNEVLKPFGDFIKVPRKGYIVVGDPGLIQIDFFHGETYKLAGVEADYYITDSYLDNLVYFKRRTAHFDKELNSLDDIFDIVVDHIKNCIVTKECEG